MGNDNTYPYLRIHDGTKDRVILGDMSANWNTDGLTYDGVGIKIFNSAGNLVFGNTADATIRLVGFTAETDRLYTGANPNIAGIKKYLSAGTDIAFFAGATDSAGTSAVFKVTYAGEVTMTKATIKSAASGQRIEISSATNDIKAYDGGNNNTFQLYASSSVTYFTAVTAAPIYFTSTAGAYVGFLDSASSLVLGLDIGTTARRIALFGAFDGSLMGDGVIKLTNATTAPSQNPTGAGYLWSSGGALKWRGSSGTITTVAPADPHCPRCGTDYMKEFDNKKFGYFAICLKCLADEIGERPWIIRSESRETI
jgi:hypothetical protein